MDYILREIEKMGRMIEAILTKIGLLKNSGNRESIYQVTKVELLEKMDLNIDTLLEKDNLVDILTKEYGFDNNSLEKFAELLFDLAEASEDKVVIGRLAAGIGAIFGQLEKFGTYSLKTHYILKELEKQM
jgi:hypothetical protein